MIMLLLFYFLIFPGFLFLFSSGLAVSWLERKISARFQWRVGPVFLQPYYDLRKLMLKEIVVPQNADFFVFALAPLVSVISALLVSDLIIVSWIDRNSFFTGDLIVLIYLISMPAIASMLGGSASGSTYASLGTGREMKIILAYELPLIISILVPVIKTNSLSVGEIINYQIQNGPILMSFSGAIAFVTVFFCLHAKLGMAPFDISEAETEICSGTLVEYSGPLLALWKISKMMMMVVVPLFLIVLFIGPKSVFAVILQYFAVFFVIAVLKNTNPRIRIDQFMKFSWLFLSGLSVIALILCLAGL